MLFSAINEKFDGNFGFVFLHCTYALNDIDEDPFLIIKHNLDRFRRFVIAYSTAYPAFISITTKGTTLLRALLDTGSDLISSIENKGLRNDEGLPCVA